MKYLRLLKRDILTGVKPALCTDRNILEDSYEPVKHFLDFPLWEYRIVSFWRTKNQELSSSSRKMLFLSLRSSRQYFFKQWFLPNFELKDFPDFPNWNLTSNQLLPHCRLDRLTKLVRNVYSRGRLVVGGSLTANQSHVDNFCNLLKAWPATNK